MRSPATWRHAVFPGLGVFAAAYVALRLATSRGAAAPANSWLAVGVIVLLVCFLLVAGRQVLTYLRGKAVRPLDPRMARLTLVSAQASVMGGGALAGWYLAQAAIHLRRLDVDRSRSALILALVLAIGGIVLSAAGFVVQNWCRVDPDDEDVPPGSASGQAG